MRYIFLLLVVCTVVQAQNPQLDEAKALVYKDAEQAKVLASNFLEDTNKYIASKAAAIVAKAEEKQGQFLKAYKYYSLALEQLYNSDTLDYYLEYALFQNLAVIAANNNAYPIAAEHYKKAVVAASAYVKYFPDVATKYNEQFLPNKMKFYQANALYDAGKIDEALKLYLAIDEGLNSKPVEDLNTYALVRNEYGLNAKAIKDYSQAKYYFTSIVQMSGVSDFYKTSAMHNLALNYQEQGLYEEALQSFDAALEFKQGVVEAQHFVTLMDRGELLLQMNRQEEAVASLNAALSKKIDMSHNLEMIRVYYLLERATKSNIAESNRYGDTFDQMMKDFIVYQKELIAAEKKRVFSMAMAEAYQAKKIAEMQQQLLIKDLLLAARWISLTALVVFFATQYYRRYQARKIAMM